MNLRINALQYVILGLSKDGNLIIFLYVLLTMILKFYFRSNFTNKFELKISSIKKIKNSRIILNLADFYSHFKIMSCGIILVFNKSSKFSNIYFDNPKTFM